MRVWARFEQAVKTLRKSIDLAGRGQTTGFVHVNVEVNIDRVGLRLSESDEDVFRRSGCLARLFGSLSSRPFR